MEINMKANLTSTGKASVEFEISNVKGTETKDEVESIITLAIEVFNIMKRKALEEYGYLNNVLR